LKFKKQPTFLKIDVDLVWSHWAG